MGKTISLGARTLCFQGEVERTNEKTRKTGSINEVLRRGGEATCMGRAKKSRRSRRRNVPFAEHGGKNRRSTPKSSDFWPCRDAMNRGLGCSMFIYRQGRRGSRDRSSPDQEQGR